MDNIFLNLDECADGSKICPPNSDCSDPDLNANETATCTCKAGYTGNETFCKGENDSMYKFLLLKNKGN